MLKREKGKEISQRDNIVVLGGRIEGCFGVYLFVFLYMLTFLNMAVLLL